ncbi:hypothetical protein BGP75_17245 [Motiliproteus sp. MSK22-1]|nr:hypothetical protein BGP75_17245 [Motiliproteus sp. MSK22-1]
MFMNTIAGFKSTAAVAEKWLVLALVCLFPVVMGTIESAASTIFILLSLVGLLTIYKDWRLIASWEKAILYGFMLFVGYQLFSVLMSDDSNRAWHRFEKVVRFLLAVPIYLLIRRYADVAYRALLIGLIVSGPVMLWVAFETMEGGRAIGAYNYIVYGDFSLMVCLSALSAALLAGRGRWMNFMLLVSAMLTLYTSLLTQTRGAWLVLPFAFLLFVWICIKRYQGNKRNWILGGTLIIALSAGGALTTTDIFQDRAQNAVVSWDQYWEGTIEGSIGLRFLKWEAAIEHWQAHPLIGSGIGDYWLDTKELAAKEPRFRVIEEYTEAHSLYFEVLATTGLIGFLLLIWAVFFQPFRYFWQRIYDSGNPIVQYLAFDGVLIIAAVMIDGISQNWLSRNPLTTAYIFFLVLFLTGIARLECSKQN